ncbi:MAG: nitronate monooxygenase [Verrucomicrobia bacterium]|nr:nitronate monooxygenase [Verrucomicrobiota bacterium]MBV8483438.1 nitronate monooxygenase [Verrucomicrobiota bacterium]
MANRSPNKFLTRLRMTKPIIQAPMTGYVTEQMVIAVSNAGGLGFLPATLLPPHAVGESVALLRQRTRGPIGVNFVAHAAVTPDVERDVAWRARLTARHLLCLRSRPRRRPRPRFGLKRSDGVWECWSIAHYPNRQSIPDPLQYGLPNPPNRDPTSNPHRDSQK